ncbi:DUF3857 domain-containing transglutaminase family protein [Snuella lapsa]|uniref:DUF3857 domain-containing protein n=1 Tax=Snuella lapsa TaxID=870481 RepID=A0ABP6X9M1_9FLAO
MSIKNSIKVVFFFTTLMASSQGKLYNSFLIPDNLKQYANAVVRSCETNVLLKSSDEMVITEKRIVTVLNKEGDAAVDAYVHYDNNVKIKTLEVLVFNHLGNQIKKIKKNEFKDVSAVDGGTLYSDSRVKYLEYTPISYPYTIEFTYEIHTNNTAFIRPFMPLNDYFVSVENSSYSLVYAEGLTIRKKERNLEGINIEKEELSGKVFYKAKNIEATRPEDYSPLFSDTMPKVLFASQQFALEGVQTTVEDWNDFGKWMYHDLIKDTHDLPESTINMVKDLVKDEKTDIDKAKKIYKYVQDKVRYISVQVGIGGWKPFNASEVDKLGYGDCKGLTNYTMSLLKAAGLNSNYAVVYAGSGQRNIENNFASVQGNHVILNIPVEDQEDIWLECTSQKLPFGFIGDFTDDRDVLVITPEGGKIVHTKKYTTEESTQVLNASYSITNEGGIEATVSIRSKGIQYDDKYWLETETERDLDVHYKKRWKYINGLAIDKMNIENDKNNVVFVETIGFNTSNYAKVIGDRMLVTINALNRNTHVPDRYRDRKWPLKILRGFKDVDKVEIKLPQGYKVESLPKNKIIETKFGSHKTEIEVVDDSTLLYKRQFVVSDGAFPKEDYDSFRNFYKEVAKQDNSKIALIKTKNK